MTFDSTLLPVLKDKDDEREVRKGVLDLLNKVNEIDVKVPNWNSVSITDNYTVVLGDKTIFVATANAITITIPDGFPIGYELTVQRVVAGTTNNITISASETIEGSATFTIPPFGVYSVYGFRKMSNSVWTSSMAQVPPVVRAKYRIGPVLINSISVGFGAGAYTKLIDTHTIYDNVSSFKPSVPGVYHIIASYLVPRSAINNEVFFNVLKNGVVIGSDDGHIPAIALAFLRLTVSVYEYFNGTTDALALNVGVVTSAITGYNDASANAQYNRLEIVYVGK